MVISAKESTSLTINIKKDKIDDDDDDLIISIDSTGIKVTNRGQWMDDEKWNVQNRKGRLSQDPRCCKHKDKGNPCSRSNRREST